MNISLLFQDVKYTCEHPELAVAIGRNEAILLTQIGYWIHKNSLDDSKYATHYIDDQWWMYNTFNDWVDTIKVCSARTIKRAVKNLQEAGLIMVGKHFPKKSNAARTNWYTLNYDAVIQLLTRLGLRSAPPPNLGTMHSANLSPSYIYSNTTSQKVNLMPAAPIDLNQMKATRTSLPADWQCSDDLRTELQQKHGWSDQQLSIVVDKFKKHYYKHHNKRYIDWGDSFRWFCVQYRPDKAFIALQVEMARKARLKDREGARVEELVHNIQQEPEVNKHILQAILDAVGSRRFIQDGFWCFRVDDVQDTRLRIKRSFQAGPRPDNRHEQVVLAAAREALGHSLSKVEFV